jgi:hypothetical protein
MLAGKDPVVESCADASDVKIPGGGGGETDTDFGSFHIFLSN